MVGVESMQVPLETWGERSGKIVLARSLNGSEDGKDRKDAEPGVECVGAGVS